MVINFRPMIPLQKSPMGNPMKNPIVFPQKIGHWKFLPMGISWEVFVWELFSNGQSLVGKPWDFFPMGTPMGCTHGIFPHRDAPWDFVPMVMPWDFACHHGTHWELTCPMVTRKIPWNNHENKVPWGILSRQPMWPCCQSQMTFSSVVNITSGVPRNFCSGGGTFLYKKLMTFF